MNRRLPALATLCLLAALSAAAAPAAAQAPTQPPAPAWVKLGETTGAVLYLDRASTKQLDEDTWQAVEMQDLKKPDPDGVLSRRYVAEYNCKYQMYRIGKVTSHAGARLTGQQLFDVGDFGYWRKVAGNTLFALGFVVHCAK